MENNVGREGNDDKHLDLNLAKLFKTDCTNRHALFQTERTFHNYTMSFMILIRNSKFTIIKIRGIASPHFDIHQIEHFCFT